MSLGLSCAARRRPPRAAVPRVARAGSAPPAPPVKHECRARHVIYAVDGTKDSEDGLRWASHSILREGDEIVLVHVLADARAPNTAVGSSGASTQWVSSQVERSYDAERLARLEAEAAAMLEGRYLPLVSRADVRARCVVARLKVHRSAAGIGEAMTERLADVGADLVLLPSHGPGVLADFGSVARWVAEHSLVPVMLLPPAVLAEGARAGGEACVEEWSADRPSILVAGAGDEPSGLLNALDWVLDRLARAGDALQLMFVTDAYADGAGREQAARELEARARSGMQARGMADEIPLRAVVLGSRGEGAHALSGGQNEPRSPSQDASLDFFALAAAAGKTSVNFTANYPDPAAAAGKTSVNFTANYPDPAAAAGGNAPGEAVCRAAAAAASRAVVVARHAGHVAHELRFGGVTAHVVKHCTRPLVTLTPTQVEHARRGGGGGVGRRPDRDAIVLEEKEMPAHERSTRGVQSVRRAGT